MSKVTLSDSRTMASLTTEPERGDSTRAASEDGHQNPDAEAQNETIDSEGQNKGAGQGNPHDETTDIQIAEANHQVYRTESHAA